jgi:hypothetical protein
MVIVAAPTAEVVNPEAVAIALMVVVDVIERAVLYTVLDVVGVDPSVV